MKYNVNNLWLQPIRTVLLSLLMINTSGAINDLTEIENEANSGSFEVFGALVTLPCFLANANHTPLEESEESQLDLELSGCNGSNSELLPVQMNIVKLSSSLSAPKEVINQTKLMLLDSSHQASVLLPPSQKSPDAPSLRFHLEMHYD